MEPHSPNDNGVDPRDVLEGQLRECYGRVVYSHKTHEKCADLLLSRLATVKGAQIALSAATTAGFIGAAFGSGTVSALIGVAVSTVLLGLNAYTKNYDLGELAQKHKQAASDLWVVREKYLSLLADLRMRRVGLDALREQRDALLKELHAAYAGAPSTTYRAYREAQKALTQFEDMTFSDAEIDAFLPRELRREPQAATPGPSLPELHGAPQQVPGT